MGNLMDFDKLEAGAELDALVAERVMGWKWNIRNGVCYAEHDCFNAADCWPEWEPSTDIVAAWEVVEKCDGCLDIIRQSDGTWICFLGLEEQMGQGDTAPLAICRAALKAVAERSER